MLVEYCKKKGEEEEVVVVFPFKYQDFDLLGRRERNTDHHFTEVKTITHC